MTIEIGDHVRKVKGFRFVGHVLALYSFMGAQYAVVVCDPDAAQDGLQHIYKVDQLELI